jgi:hypothetical protein
MRLAFSQLLLFQINIGMQLRLSLCWYEVGLQPTLTFSNQHRDAALPFPMLV